MSKLKHNLYN